jgi:hypothetical protein
MPISSVDPAKSNFNPLARYSKVRFASTLVVPALQPEY